MFRNRRVLVAAALLGLAGCSSSGGGDPVVVGTVERPPPSVGTVSPGTTAPQAEPETAAPLQVDMSVDIDSAGIDADLTAAVDPAALDDADPFGVFASCSGARRSFSTYSVLVSQPGSQVSALSVITTSAVTGPRVYDADVRVEFPAADAVTATGTVTIGPDLRSGEFLAFEPGGGRVEGSFVCSGGDDEPAVLAVTDRDGTLESVEVVALMRRGESERVVELAVDPARSPDATAECAAAAGGSAPVVVRVDGDQSVGAISMFELTDGAAPTMRLRVGGMSYEFDEVDLTAADPAVAGTFSAVDGGVSVDGAFRCT